MHVSGVHKLERPGDWIISMETPTRDTVRVGRSLTQFEFSSASASKGFVVGALEGLGHADCVGEFDSTRLGLQ